MSMGRLKRMRKSLHFVLLTLLLLLFTVQLGSQSSGATVSIAGLPTWGQDGNLTGYVYGTSTTQVRLYAFQFIPDEGWYQLGACNAIDIQSTGQFTVNATPGIMGRYATRFLTGQSARQTMMNHSRSRDHGLRFFGCLTARPPFRLGENLVCVATFSLMSPSLPRQRGPAKP